MKTVEIGDVAGGTGTVTVTVEPGVVDAETLVNAVGAARGGSKFKAEVAR